MLNEQTLALEKTIAVGEHPHTCAFGADQKHLYVSNWGARSVSVVDSEKGKQLRELSVGVRDMQQMPKIERMDTAAEKRIELHMHTTMSTMDATADAGVRAMLTYSAS